MNYCVSSRDPFYPDPNTPPIKNPSISGDSRERRDFQRFKRFLQWNEPFRNDPYILSRQRREHGHLSLSPLPDSCTKKESWASLSIWLFSGVVVLPRDRSRTCLQVRMREQGWGVMWGCWAEYGFGEYGFKHRTQWALRGSLSSGEWTQWVPLSLLFVCQSELTEFFAELTEFATKLSEAQWVLPCETLLSRNSIPPVS